MARRQHLTATVLLAVVLFFSITYLLSGSSSSNADRTREAVVAEPKSEFKVDFDGMPANLLEGESIAPKLENATLKYVSRIPEPAPMSHRPWQCFKGYQF
jgi:hypothetical protein